MDFTFKPEHVALRKMLREFAEEEVRPRAKALDRSGRFDPALLKMMADLGLFGVPWPQEYGGMGAGEIGYCILMEEITRVCSSTSTLLGAHIGIAGMSIYLDGSEDLKRRYLVDIATGRKIAAFALTEPGAGSDAAGIQLRATPEGDSYFLDGGKMWITNGPIADLISVLAVTDPALGPHGGHTVFVVERGQEGYSSGKPERKMGLHGSPTSSLNFDGVRVPRENVVGAVGMGFATFMKTLDLGRLTVGAASLGGAQASLEQAMRWAASRKHHGRPIAELQSVHFMIADMAAEIETLRAMVYRTAWMVDDGQPIGRETGICKLYGSEVASRCVDRALQIHGALGLSRDLPVERGWRDSRISEIFDGTNEIQRIVISGHMFQELGVRIRP